MNYHDGNLKREMNLVRVISTIDDMLCHIALERSPYFPPPSVNNSSKITDFLLADIGVANRPENCEHRNSGEQTESTEVLT